MPSREAPWSDDDVALLRELWTAPEHLSVEAIARRLHRTKSAIVRKRRRLGLPARPNPLHPKATHVTRPPPRAGASTLPPLPSLADMP